MSFKRQSFRALLVGLLVVPWWWDHPFLSTFCYILVCAGVETSIGLRYPEHRICPPDKNVVTATTGKAYEYGALV